MLRRADAAGYEARLSRIESGILVGEPAGKACGGEVELAAIIQSAVVGHRDALRTERVGLYDVRAGLEIALVYLAYHVGTCDGEEVVVALLYAGQRLKL